MEDKCTCDSRVQEHHSCPFAEDVHDSEDENYCNCCAECTHQCAMDV